MNLGNQLKKLRTNRKLNQTTVANAIGITKQALSKIENNENNPSIDVFYRLLDFYGMNALYTLLSEREILDITDLSTASKIRIHKIIEEEKEIKNSYDN